MRKLGTPYTLHLSQPMSQIKVIKIIRTAPKIGSMPTPIPSTAEKNLIRKFHSLHIALGYAP